MVQLATSRYQAASLIVASGLVPVRITLGHPRYRAELDRVGLDAVQGALSDVSAGHEGRGLVLLCFEDVVKLGGLSCHRRSFAHWWYEQTGQVVPELAVPKL